MNIKTQLFVTIVGCVIQLHAQTNQPPVDNFVLVTNLWYQGYKTNVLSIAEERLLANSNDLAGLVLKMEYDLEFSNDSSLSNNVVTLLSAAEAATNIFVHTDYSKMKKNLNWFLEFLANEYHPTVSELNEEKAKALIIHKRMTYERYLKGLHDDGLF